MQAALLLKDKSIGCRLPVASEIMNLELKLYEATMNDSIICAKRALAAGALVDGDPDVGISPLILAARYGRLGIIYLLLDEGADVEVASLHDPVPGTGMKFPRGTRALHAAAAAGEVDALRALLQAGARPNVVDGDGRTPLMAACNVRLSTAQRFVATVGVLLEAGALPSLADNEGRLPLHAAAHWGADDAIEVLLAAAPGTLNRANRRGGTALCAAVRENRESSVRLLVSAGASDKEAWTNHKEGALLWAVSLGYDGVTAALLNAGVDANGGVEALIEATRRAIAADKARILDMLLGVEGEERRSWWANSRSPNGCPALGAAAFACRLAMASVLLAAGADEMVFLSGTGFSIESIGLALEEKDRDKAKEAALCRMLRRGPAFRARSYRWPVEMSAAAAAAAAGTSSISPPPVGKAQPSVPLGVRILRPTRRTFFTCRIERYTQKSSGEA